MKCPQYKQDFIHQRSEYLSNNILLPDFSHHP